MRIALLTLALLTSCSGLAVEPDPATVPGTAENNPAFHGRLRELAAAYASYQRVDDELHWAPYLCRQPEPSRPRRSASMNLDTHGRKLYYVFAKDRAAYLSHDTKTPAISGQVVIKEAWEVAEVPATTTYDTTVSPVRYLKEDGKLFFAKQITSLFIMYRSDAATPDTDSGWVYGTISADGQTITSSGRVQSCMGCHVKAPYERLFGIDYHGA